jgi:glycerol-3-phosphate O-acyltransferase
MGDRTDPRALRSSLDDSVRAKRRWWRHWAVLPIRYETQLAGPIADDANVWFVLETDRWLDRLILEDVCIRNDCPPPRRHPGELRIGFWSVHRIRGWLRRRLMPCDASDLAPIVARDRSLGGPKDVVFVPVAVFWGRAPERENSMLELFASEDWGLAGRLRRFLALLVHGRAVLVKVGEPLSVASAHAAVEADAERIASEMARALREFFAEQRAITIGPDLSHRRLLLDDVLGSEAVVAAVRREARSMDRSESRVRSRARRYAAEIAAEYSYPTVRLLERGFSWLWNRLYEGIDVRHLNGVAEVAAGAEIVYVPCHRSHIDYMLLGYVIYRSGLALPHIAAGLNLNLPLVGPILRRGGAFFIRRTFQGNALYAAVLRAYLRLILARGFPIEYFIEGTRSRTGRLLPPKLGLLGMTVQSYLADRARPIVFQPVYIGYEKLVEGETFLSELSGARKNKETLVGVLGSLKTLRERFGAVQVSFAEPIRLDALLDQYRPGWREEPQDEQFRPEWLPSLAERLGVGIMTAINGAAVINSVNLVALVVLCMPKQAIVEIELRAQLDLYLALARRAPYSARAGQAPADAAAMIAQCERLRWLSRKVHPLGDILYMDERRAVLASYYRNNIVHFFVLPSLLAAAFINRAELSVTRLQSLATELYACLRGELYLRLAGAELEDGIERTVAAMLALGLLEDRSGLLVRPADSSARAAQLRLCAEIVQPFLERYYLCVQLLLCGGQNGVTRAELVRRCKAASERLALVYSLNSPDLFQSDLFANWVGFLEESGIVSGTESIVFDEPTLGELAGALGFALPPQLRQTLVHLASAATPPASGEATRPIDESELVLRRSDPESGHSRAE